jgi:hypothetical protein
MLEKASLHYKRQQYLRFTSQLQLQEELKNRKQAFEARVLGHLALSLQKRAFYLLKLYARHSRYLT